MLLNDNSEYEQIKTLVLKIGTIENHGTSQLPGTSHFIFFVVAFAFTYVYSLEKYKFNLEQLVHSILIH